MTLTSRHLDDATSTGGDPSDIDQIRTITALRPTTSGERIKVFVDGALAATIDALGMHELDIQVGRELSDDDLRAIEQAGELGRAREMALRWLAVRPRSRMEIERRLIGRKIDRDAARRVVDRLGDAGLLDDEAFAQARLSALRAKGSGPRLIEYKLRQAGVERELIERLIRREFQDADLDREATDLASARLNRWQSDLDRRTITRRLGSYLARRGYGPGTCAKAVEAALREADKLADDHPENLE